MNKPLHGLSTRRQWLQTGAAGLLLPAAWPLAAQHGGHGGHAASTPTANRPARRRPALAMSAALAPDGRLNAVMLETTAEATPRLVLLRSADQGRSWSAPQPLAIGDDTVSADGENHPKIAFGRDGLVVIAYTRPLDKPFTGAIRLLRSTDGGATFAPPVTVHHDRQVITHRFESVAFDARGRLHVVWIDKRDLELAQAAGRRYEGAAIYRVESDDGGASFGPDTKLADHSCECCRIALAPSPDGGLVALWRHVFSGAGGQVRDHGFAPLRGPGLPSGQEAPPPQRATQDGWVVAGCPHHGPGLAPAARGGWHAVWFGERGGVAAARYGRLDASGAPSGPVRSLPDATAEHASVAAIGPQVALVWRAFDGQQMRWRAGLSSDDGASFQWRELGRTRGESDHPRLAQDGQRVLALWRCADEGLRVHPLIGA